MATVDETINLLIAQVQDTITTNGAKEIKAVDHRALLIEILEKLGELLDEPDAYLLTQFPPYVSDQLYIGGTELVVTHGGKLWAFVSEDDVTGVEPGTAVNTWYPISSLSLAHRRNRDQWLARFTANAVSAAEIRQFIDEYENTGRELKVATHSTEGTDQFVHIAAGDIVAVLVNGVFYTADHYTIEAEGEGLRLTWLGTDFTLDPNDELTIQFYETT